MAKDKRFEKVFSEGGLVCSEIWVDTHTGVQYLVHGAGSGIGLTVLVDPEGKPLLYHKTPDGPEY